MRARELVPTAVTSDALPADLFELQQALTPIQGVVAMLNPHQFRALERLLGATTGDLRFVDARVENLAVLLTDVAGDIQATPNLAGAFTHASVR